MLDDIVLEGEKVKLRKLKEIDRDALIKYLSDEEITKWLTSFPQPRKEDIEEYLRESEDLWRQGKRYVFAICFDVAKPLIGSVSLFNVSKKHKFAYIGYWVARDYWGQGIATEASSLLIDFAFRTLNFHKICTKIFRGNDASCRVIKKLGFKLEGIEREQFFKEGKYKDVFVYGLLKREWDGFRKDSLT